MRMRGLEPPRGFPHTDLNRARLPIPPHPPGRGQCSRTISGLKRGLLIFVVALGLAPVAHAGNVEVVVTLKAPPLAQAFVHQRTLAF